MWLANMMKTSRRHLKWRPFLWPSFIPIRLVLLSTTILCTFGQSEELIEMLQKMEEQTLKFAHKMEELYSKYISTCDDTFVLKQCIQNNYAGCKSKLLNDQCLGGEDWSLPQLCTSSNDIGGIFSFDVSTVHFPEIYDYVDQYENTNRVPRVTESMCYSLLADQYMKDEYEKHQDYWGQYNIAGPWYHFGSYSGLFRIYPGRPMKDCGVFPTLYRPWYVGASAGRKDVVILVDLMTQSRNEVKKAINRVVNGLGYGDYFTIVDINLNATFMSNEPPNLVSATLENKETTLEEYFNNSNDVVQERRASSKGFELVMEALQKPNYREVTSDCRRAILYLTDAGEQDLTDEEMSKIRSIMNETKMKAGDESYLSIFTYSLGVGDDNKFVKELACENNGISHSITDFNMLEESMGTYFKYFSYGLGDGLNHDYVAWSEPYLFATGDQLGTTVSAPVYDTSVTPNVLIGVVGLDIWLHVLEKAARDGKNNTEDESNTNFVLKKLAERSVPFCPYRTLSESQIQGLRLAEGDEAVCKNQAEPDKTFVRDVCDHFKEPLDVYANLDYEDLDHDERSCCCLGDSSSMDCEFNHTFTQSGNSGTKIRPFARIVGLIALATIIFLVFFLYIIREAFFNFKEANPDDGNQDDDNDPAEVNAPEEINAPAEGDGLAEGNGPDYVSVLYQPDDDDDDDISPLSDPTIQEDTIIVPPWNVQPIPNDSVQPIPNDNDFATILAIL